MGAAMLANQASSLSNYRFFPVTKAAAEDSTRLSIAQSQVFFSGLLDCWHLPLSAPDEIDRNAGEREQVADAGCCGSEKREMGNQKGRKAKKDDRNKRILPGLIGSFECRSAAAENDDRENRERSENKVNRNDVFEKLRIDVAENGCRRVCRRKGHGPRQNENRSPHPLRDESRRGNISSVCPAKRRDGLAPSRK